MQGSEERRMLKATFDSGDNVLHPPIQLELGELSAAFEPFRNGLLQFQTAVNDFLTAQIAQNPAVDEASVKTASDSEETPSFE